MFAEHRQLYTMAAGMGGVGWSGIMPADVANLTWFQVRNDYFAQFNAKAKEIEKRMSKNATLPTPETQEQPTREMWVGLLMASHPDWTAAQCHADYDELIRTWDD